MRTALLALVGFGVGWTLVVAIRTSTEPSPDQEPSVAPAALDRELVEREPPNVDAPATPSEPEGQGAENPFWSLSSREQFEELVRRHEVPAAIQVPNRIFGRVVDLWGRPIRDVELELTPVLRPLDATRPPLEPAEFIRRRLRERAWAKEHRQVTVSDDAGEFDVGDLIASSYRVSPTRTSGASTVLVEPGAWCEIVRWPTGAKRIDLRVEDKLGTPVGTMIAVRHPDPQLLKLLFERGELRRQDSGLFSKMLAPVSYPLNSGLPSEVREFLAVAGMEFAIPPVSWTGISSKTFRASDQWPEQWDWVRWNGSDGELVLQREMIRVDLDAHLFQGCENSIAQVGVLPVASDGPVDAENFARSARWTDALGCVPRGPNTVRVAIDVPAGLVQIGVVLGIRSRRTFSSFGPQPSPSVVHALETFDVQSSDPLSFDVREPAIEGAYSIDLTDARGRPVHELREVRMRVGSGHWVRVTPIRLSRGGYTAPAPARIADGHRDHDLEYELSIAGEAKIEGSIVAGGTRRIEHQLDPGASLTIRVREPNQRDRSWVPNVVVSIDLEEVGLIRNGRIGHRRTLEDVQVPAGVVTVRASKGSARLFDRVVALESSEAREIEIELPSLYPLDVEFGTDAPRRVDLKEPGGGRIAVNVGTQVHLPAGIYEVVPRKDGFNERPGSFGTVTIPDQDRVTVSTIDGEE